MDEQQQRLFLALQPPAEAAGELYRLAEGQGLTGKPVPTVNLHLTLVFLGLCDARQQAVVEGIAGETRGETITLALDRLEYWHRPRIQVLCPSEPPATLLALQQRLQAGLEQAGLQVERRPYRPHMTLSRKARPVENGDVRGPLLQFRQFHLFVSRSGPDGVRYTPLRSWPLG